MRIIIRIALIVLIFIVIPIFIGKMIAFGGHHDD